MKWIILSNATGILMAIFAYFIFVKQFIRFKRDWKKNFNEEHPDIKNPYTQGIAIWFPVVILIVFFALGIFAEGIITLQDQKHICIDTIQEWSESRGLVTTTSHVAYLNNEYKINFERPNQYSVGDCFMIYKYTNSWRLRKLDGGGKPI